MERGLTSDQVAQRLADGQSNSAPPTGSRTLGQIARANLLTRFNAILGTLFVIMVIAGPWQDALFGLVIVANTAIGSVQEWRAKQTLDRLTVLGEARPRVRRDGAEQTIRAQELVTDDIVLLGPGEKIPVDGDVVEAAGLEIDESLLTGEADPAPKAVGDELLSGAFVAAGTGAYRATRVGPAAYAARLTAEASAFTLVRSELRSGVDRILTYVTWLMIPAGVLQIVTQALTSNGLREGISHTVAGLVPMVPEGLVLLLSMAFALGVLRLGRRQCLVRELPAIEGLARVDVVCLDKTGTLTQGGMRVAELRLLDSTRSASVPAEPASPASVTSSVTSQAARHAAPHATSQAAPHAGAVSGAVSSGTGSTGAGARSGAAGDAIAALCAAEERPNATIAALAEAYPEAPFGWTPELTRPFSSARKWSGVTFAEHGSWVLGAADTLLPADDPVRAEAESAGAGGLRVLLLARASLHIDAADAPGTVTPVALVLLEQRLRDDAHDTLEYFARQGVAVKVISGDNAASVGAVAAAVGVPDAERMVDARDLPPIPSEHDGDTKSGAGTGTGTGTERDPGSGAGSSAASGTGGSGDFRDAGEFGEVVERGTVFGRVAPGQKRAMVRALRAWGHVVAMTGDGVNDVLALKDADIGVAMGSGADATRAVAQLVLLDDSFASLPEVVAEGRRVIGNIERVSRLFLVKTVYSLLLVVLVGIARLPFPFLPRHVTLIGALTIGVPSFFLALAPNTERARPGFVERVLRFAIPAGAAAAGATFVAYYLARADGGSSLDADQTTAAVTLFAITLWVLAIVARPYTWRRVGLIVLMGLIFVLVLAVPSGRDFFDLHPDDGAHIGIGLASAAIAAVVLEVAWRVLSVRARETTF